MRRPPGCDQSSGTESVAHSSAPHPCQTIDPVRSVRGEEHEVKAATATIATASPPVSPRFQRPGRRPPRRARGRFVRRARRAGRAAHGGTLRSAHGDPSARP